MLYWDLQENAKTTAALLTCQHTWGERKEARLYSSQWDVVSHSQFFASLAESGKRNGLKHQAQYGSGTNGTLQESQERVKLVGVQKPASGLEVLLLDGGKHPPS